MLDLTTEHTADQCTWRLLGAMTMLNLGAHWTQLMAQFPSAKKWRIDLSEVQHSDSAALAFLIACLRHANKTKAKLTLSGLSQDLRELMNVQGLKDIFKDTLPA